MPWMRRFFKFQLLSRNEDSNPPRSLYYISHFTVNLITIISQIYIVTFTSRVSRCQPNPRFEARENHHNDMILNFSNGVIAYEGHTNACAGGETRSPISHRNISISLINQLWIRCTLRIHYPSGWTYLSIDWANFATPSSWKWKMKIKFDSKHPLKWISHDDL